MVAEIWDYRAIVIRCPVTAAALPRRASPPSQSRGFTSWQVQLRPAEAANRPCRGDAFDHFRQLSSEELEILAGDAKRQLLEEGSVLAWHEVENTRLQPALASIDTRQQEDRKATGSVTGGTSLQVNRKPGAGQGVAQPAGIRGGEWIDVGIGASSPTRPLNPYSTRYNLTLDKEAFPALAQSRFAAPAILSPTEPKRQMIGDAQRQQVARQGKWPIAGSYAPTMIRVAFEPAD